ncbi:MAG: phenylalanine--tRNA ligase subunit beta [Saprospiraceae bacterium]|nr:phenylalanine--tRNA ligase subunit beta [Saprospiraceae bacterium]MCF8250299.1 phenylalanine--tRNA ligase subunit beta [Saprospiraceae bacterium]MCF8280976.1 phenylalanine--tRNA ligase subunit beta [Bacteroidales bacterium]MCF8312069.1 phenylalanine--tRNA ligase subunit beta [Saprospiraceae bacterium]MCF8440476.1 phenylalanine--tRNA ligase subunit beta [Saprospiraceae bacterium]
MTISLNWLKEYIDINLPAEEISNLLTSLGLEVEGMEEVESIKGGLEGVVVGEVKECWRHPNADKLSLTKVDIGTGDLLQIVCGAPNVAAGQRVLVATVGTTLYPTGSEPLTLKLGKIRGEESQGMICASDELGLSEDHSGILVLPADTAIGTTGRDYFKLEKDIVYEIGLTPNRSDATCHLGVARDLAAALQVQFGQTSGVKMPSVENFKVNNNSLPVAVMVENTEACPRYAGVTIKGVTIGESPDWLKKRLLSIGVRPISNVVDITNFILHELGQPLHAFDLDEIAGQKIIVKTLPEGTKFQSLDERERSLSDHDLMICDGDSNGMCIGGVFGGATSGVKDTTKNIFLESAHFNAKWIRRSSTRHDLRTDAAKVFEKGSDPNICVYALKRAAAMIVELAGGEIASEVVDVYPNPIENQLITVSFDYVNRLIGMEIPKEKINEILSALEMKIMAETSDSFTVSVPTDKADVTRPADVVEEILRVFGLDNVPAPAQIRSSMVASEKPDPNAVRNTVADFLAANGFNEVMNLSLSQSAFHKEILPKETSELVFVNNTSNVQLDIMRPTMLFSGLEAVVNNQNRQQSDLKLFEFGKTYHPIADSTASNPQSTIRNPQYIEPQHLTLFLTGQRWPESWRNKEKVSADFFTLKSFVGNVLTRLGVGSGFQETAVKDEVLAYGIKYHRGPQDLVVFGKVQPKVCKKMGVRGEVFYADLNWDALLAAAKKQSISFAELNKYPTVRRDLAVVIGKSVKFSDLAAVAKKVGKKLLKDINLFDVFEDETKLGEGKKSYALSFSFEDPTRTLQDKEVDAVMNELIEAFEGKLGALIRR